SLKNLLFFAKNHPDTGIIGSRLLNPDGTVQPSVYHFPTIRRAIKEYFFGKKGSYEKYAPNSEKPLEVEALVGATMLIPKTVFEKVGLLDERYFMYFEDFDFCRRVKSAGLKIYYLPESRIFHHHGASGKKLGGKTSEFLVKSSKIYNGRLKYYLFTLIIRLSQNRLTRLFNR
ncbi:MAG: glycosyltransferase family 2 protein, partial [bacterium]|nr:glycosyltransferase family 2 protein [bacterium]